MAPSLAYDTHYKQNPGGWGGDEIPPTQTTKPKPAHVGWKKISGFHQVKGKNTLARSQRQGFGSQPKQELKSKTIFSCSQLRLLRQKWRRGGRGEGATEEGENGRGQERNVFFISQCIIYKQH